MRGAVLVQLLRTLVVPVKAVGLSLQTKQPSSSLLCRQLFIPSPHPFIRRKPLHEVNVQCFHLIPHVPDVGSFALPAEFPGPFLHMVHC